MADSVACVINCCRGEVTAFHLSFTTATITNNHIHIYACGCACHVTKKKEKGKRGTEAKPYSLIH